MSAKWRFLLVYRAHGSDRGPIRQAQGFVISLLQHLPSEYLGPADQLLGAGTFQY